LRKGPEAGHFRHFGATWAPRRNRRVARSVIRDKAIVGATLAQPEMLPLVASYA